MRRAAARLPAPLPALALAAALLAAAPARAQIAAHSLPGTASDFRVQLALGAGLSRWDSGCGGGAACDDGGSAGRAALAVTVVRGLALEAVALDLGRAEQRQGGQGGQVLRQQARMLGLGLMAPLELGPRLGAELRAGIGRVQVRRERSAGAAAPLAVDDASPEFYAGAALTLALAPQVWLQVGWDATLARLDAGTRRIGAATAGVALRF